MDDKTRSWYLDLFSWWVDMFKQWYKIFFTVGKCVVQDIDDFNEKVENLYKDFNMG